MAKYAPTGSVSISAWNRLSAALRKYDDVSHVAFGPPPYQGGVRGGSTRRGQSTSPWPPPSKESVDKKVRPSIRRQKKAATRGERFKYSRKRFENPFAPSRPHFFRGRIEGP